MIRVFKPFVALLMLAACALPERAPSAAALSAVEAGATGLVEEWARSGSEGRWDDLVALYADQPGFTWVEQGRIAYADHAAISAGVAQARDSGLSVRTTVSDIAATPLSSNAAAVRAKVSIVLGDPSTGGFAFDGILTGVAIERDGRWMFLQGHLSGPPPSAAAAP
jgi:D-serine deaminase-like pyridoxal phosphate-dependent protein